MSQVRVNVRSRVNNAAIRRENRDGREVIIVPSATLPDNIVMNGIMYPADEIGQSYMTLNRTPAPFGHPVVNGQYISAREPEAINGHWIGAWNENVRRANGRVMLDKVIDPEVAVRHPEGQRLLNAIDADDPIHTSTGVMMELDEAAEGEEAYRFIARNMVFDHDAILLDEVGAATPEQGVGMMVNGEQVEVINSEMPEDDDMRFAIDMLIESVERQERRARTNGLYEKFVEAIKNVLSFKPEATGLGVNENQEVDEMSDVKREEFDALVSTVNKLTETVDNNQTTINETITNALQPVTDKLTKIDEANQAAEQAEREKLIERVVNVGLLDEDESKELTTNALRKLAEKAKPGTAAPIAGHFEGNQHDEWADYDLNANMETK